MHVSLPNLLQLLHSPSVTMSDAFSRIEISVLEGRAQSVRLRQKLLHSLHAALRSSEKAIKQAIADDTGYSDHDINVEYSLTISDLRTHYESLDLRRELDSQKALQNLEATTCVGSVYIIPAKQNLLYSVISALTAALAAGNCVILEVWTPDSRGTGLTQGNHQLPTTLSRISGLLRELLPSALCADVFATSDTRLSTDLLSRCYVVDQEHDAGTVQSDSDSKVTDSSSPRVVAIVDRTGNVREAALAIGASRTAFDGNAAYAPELVFVNEFVADDLLFHVCQAMMSPVPEHKNTASQRLSKVRPGAHAKVMESRAYSDGVKVIMSGDNGSVIEITDS